MLHSPFARKGRRIYDHVRCGGESAVRSLARQPAFAFTSFKLRRTPRFALALRGAAPRVSGAHGPRPWDLLRALRERGWKARRWYLSPIKLVQAGRTVIATGVA